MKNISLVHDADIYTVREPLSLKDVLELGKYDGNLVYLEHRNRWEGTLYDGFYEPVSEVDGNSVCFYVPGTGSMIATYHHGYNRQWRCWLHQPTAAESRAAKWR